MKDSRWTGSSDHKLHFCIVSPNSRKSGFRAIDFHLLQTEGGGVNGTMAIGMDPSLAKGLWQSFLSMFRIGPVETKPFQLTASQLLLPDGAANHAAIARAIEEVIESVMAPRR